MEGESDEMTADARIERLMARRDRWVAAATEARIERDAATARADKAEAERDAARRVLLAAADACVHLSSHRLVGAIDEALGFTGSSADWHDTATALRKVCGVSDG